jgi:tyrosyl-tRNA synthetase
MRVRTSNAEGTKMRKSVETLIITASAALMLTATATSAFATTNRPVKQSGSPFYTCVERHTDLTYTQINDVFRQALSSRSEADEALAALADVNVKVIAACWSASKAATKTPHPALPSWLNAGHLREG